MPVFNIGPGEAFRTPTLNGSYPADVHLTFLAGESKSASFQVQVTDEGMPASHTYQWYVNGEAVSGATAASYTMSGLSAEGTYSVYCRVTNNAGTVQSREASLTLVEYKVPVLAQSLPADQSLTVIESASGSASFSVEIAAAGVPASYTYQWYWNGSAVSGATGSSYTRTDLTAGTYAVYCRVTNEAGTVQSRTATVTVTQYTRPVLTSSLPANVSVMESAAGSAAFRVTIATAGNPDSYTYQWYVNGEAVSGATSDSYTQTGLTAAASYTVYCRVTNAAGTVQSRTATLTVTSAYPSYTHSGTSVLTDEGNYNWNIQLKTSGTFKFTSLGNASGGIDVFCVGGGGGSASWKGGAGGGYTKTTRGVSVEAGTAYTITIGAGGTSKGTDAGDGGRGGTTTAFGVSAAGGYGSVDADYREGEEEKIYAYMVGANGGSGGGGYGGAGGTNGGNGEQGEANYGGTGQGSTTRAFGESSGTVYSAGGNGHMGGYNIVASANSGRGASAGDSTGVFNGGSGIVIIRNKR